MTEKALERETLEQIISIACPILSTMDLNHLRDLVKYNGDIRYKLTFAIKMLLSLKNSKISRKSRIKYLNETANSLALVDSRSEYFFECLAMATHIYHSIGNENWKKCIPYIKFIANSDVNKYKQLTSLRQKNLYNIDTYMKLIELGQRTTARQQTAVGQRGLLTKLTTATNIMKKKTERNETYEKDTQ